MKISVTTENGYLPAAYSKFAADQDKVGRYPVQSFPFEVDDLPADTKFLAWAYIDFDSVPVMGFPWIHWLAANFPVTGENAKVPANLSKATTLGGSSFIQGENSTYSRYITEDVAELKQAYIGPVPPDKDHRYTLTVFACAAELPLTAGFFLNDLHHLATDRPDLILAETSIDILAQA
ncbi:YbhB/YbcL family Raf kinase inhibitor-like protein [Fructobacillus ficulneus]|uniref:Raf-like protein n=1 Tax=Fructobacillus ficulneus TaxID=157463 RepID=A0A0K8MG15_9LACO|nr:YbhB/YbcL family Raf kinase inhibitor-like protein [Fructobacillus ficulneus]GAO99456.1 Raf-like protein [Fructobacillus ficulneus]